MNAPEVIVAEALDALRIESPDAYSWFGRRFAGDPSGGIRDAIQDRLFTSFYCLGAATPHAGPDGGLRPMRAPELVDRLSRANTGRGGWEPGWRVAGRERGVLIVERRGLRVWAEPSEVRATTGDGTVALRRAKERLHAVPGFYLALGDAFERSPEDAVRFYLNLTCEGAPALVMALTRRLNRTGTPFQLKVLDDPRGFTRCDAAVLFVADRDREVAEQQVREVAAEIAPHLGSSVPALTLAVARGVGFAEDPGGGESFGMSRCRLVADAILRSHERGDETPAARLASVADRFAEAGLDLRRPFLRPAGVRHARARVASPA